MRSHEFLDPDPNEEPDEHEPEPHYEDEEPVDPDPGIEADGADDDNLVHDEDAPEDQEDESVVPTAGAHPEGGREIRWVPLGDLQLDRRFWTNPRLFTGLDDADIQALADDILAKTVTDEKDVFAGISEPLLVVQIKDGDDIEQLVLDGQRRYLATQVAYPGKEADGVLVPVVDREPEPVEWSQELAQKYLREALTAVTLRQGLSAFELSESASRLRAGNDEKTGNVMTIAKIATIIGRSESWVSKIVGARALASAGLLERWRKGAISEEQFRDLATGTKGAEQDKEAAKVADARASGDKGGARQSAKEKKELARLAAQAQRQKKKDEEVAAKQRARDEKAAKKAAKSAGKKGPAVKGPQAELPIAAAPKAPEESKPASKPKAMDRVIVDDILEMVQKKPPTHDLVRGVILGIQVAAGRMDMEQLPKQWHQYIHHATGTTPPKPKKGKKK
jgi:hypothetical protein